jgi:hypothetical protein
VTHRYIVDNARNTHVANNTGAVFSVFHAVTFVMQRAIHEANNTEDGVFHWVRPEAIKLESVCN